MEQLLFTVEETKRILGIGRSVLYEKLQSGELRSIRIGRSRRISKAAIDDFVTHLMAEDKSSR